MTRRRKNAKPKTENNTKEIQENKSEIKYTPVQVEQTKLAKQLESYIKEFEAKVKQLNSKMLDRELVILFVANLHPRWKRLIEPVEHSFQQWEDAADVASYHCIRLSALLGCERNDSSQIFTTQESKDILRSGYFASETNPDVERHPGENLIPHLISPTPTSSTVKNATGLPITSATPVVNIEKKDKAKEKAREKDKEREREAEKTKEKAIEKETKKQKKTEEKEVERIEKPKQEIKKEIAKSEKKKVLIVETTPAENHYQKNEDIPTQPDSTHNKPQNIDNKESKLSTLENDVCFKVPECYKDVNLMFLSLSVNGKNVKGLLSKLSWGCSAISIDCVKRLGLTVASSDSYCINTEFGIVDSLGFVDLPVIHPADHNIKSELRAQVLPLIYNGKVDLIFGSDFFFKFKPTLNIKQRAIRFLDKEVPYFVHKLN